MDVLQRSTNAELKGLVKTESLVASESQADLSSAQLQKLTHCLEEQAKVVEDLQFVVCDELRALRESKTPNPIARGLQEKVEDQARLMDELHRLVLGLSRQFAREVYSEESSRLRARVDSLEENFGCLVAVIRGIRDHSANALDDRIAMAVGEVQRRVNGCIASLQERANQMPGSPGGPCQLDACSRRSRSRGSGACVPVVVQPPSDRTVRQSSSLMSPSAPSAASAEWQAYRPLAESSSGSQFSQ